MKAYNITILYGTMVKSFTKYLANYCLHEVVADTLILPSSMMQWGVANIVRWIAIVVGRDVFKH